LKAERKPAGRGFSGVVGQAAPYMGIGMAIAVSVLVPLWVGHRLDRRFGTDPLWLLVGSAFGLLGAFYQFFKAYRTFTDRK
jgi:hypothetical protein